MSCISLLWSSYSAPTTTTSTTLLQELPESVQVQLETLLTSLINQSATFGTAVLTSEHLLTLLDVFKGTRKVQLCRDILESLKAPQDAAGATGTGQMSRDPVLINTLFDLARIVHDAVDGLAAFDDVSYTAGLLGNHCLMMPVFIVTYSPCIEHLCINDSGLRHTHGLRTRPRTTTQLLRRMSRGLP